MVLRAYGTDLAHIHDDGFGAPARHAAALLLAELRRAGIRRGLVVDLGCGSGLLAAPIAAAGYDVLGIDLSPAMLAIARRRVPAARFCRASLLDAPLPACVAVAAVGECFNYLFDRGNTPAAVRRLLRRIRAALAGDGVLLCDVAGPGRAGGQGEQRKYVEGSDWTVLVSAEERGRRLTRTITTFRRRGALYRRDHEVHELRLWSAAEMQSALRAAGFRVRALRRYGAFTMPPGLTGYLARPNR